VLQFLGENYDYTLFLEVNYVLVDWADDELKSDPRGTGPNPILIRDRIWKFAFSERLVNLRLQIYFVLLGLNGGNLPIVATSRPAYTHLPTLIPEERGFIKLPAV
jgi:hypothetical protein